MNEEEFDEYEELDFEEDDFESDASLLSQRNMSNWQRLEEHMERRVLREQLNDLF